MNIGTQNNYGIAIFHNIGDILLCTPIARQLKADAPDCHIVWFTSQRYAFVLDNNPYIDEVIALPDVPLDKCRILDTLLPHATPENAGLLALNSEIPKLRNAVNWTRFFTPAPYLNYAEFAKIGRNSSLLDIIKSYVGFNWSVSDLPVMRLTDDEVSKAHEYISTLPPGIKILIETEFKSAQSYFDIDCVLKVITSTLHLKPTIIFTAKNKPSFFDDLVALYDHLFWFSGEFRLNAEIYNHCHGFVGVSSGISTLTYSDWCRNDLPKLEASLGENWSAFQRISHYRLMPCYSKTIFMEKISDFVAILEESIDPDKKQMPLEKDFSCSSCLPEDKSTSSACSDNVKAFQTKNIVACQLCNSSEYIPLRGNDIVCCTSCGFVYLRERMNMQAMEQYYRDVYAVDNPKAAPSVRVPSSLAIVDTDPEYVASQRRELLNEAILAHGEITNNHVLIDIGCGWGALLHYGRSLGMQVMGFEFTRPNVEFGRNILKLDIRQQQFAESQIPDNSVDIITMSHSLEHLPDPVACIKKIHAVLKPGGIFCCVVPNFDSLSSECLGEEWYWLEREWHYSHFSPFTLQKAVTANGLVVISSETRSGDFGTSIPLAILHKLYPSKMETELAVQLRQQELIGKGEEIKLLARKNPYSLNYKGVITEKINKLYTTSNTNTLVTSSTSSINRILWIRPDSIGDNILAASMLPYIKQKYPKAIITVLCQEHIAELYTVFPFLVNIISFNKTMADKNTDYCSLIKEKIKAVKADLVLNTVYSRDELNLVFTLSCDSSEIVAIDGDTSNISTEVKLTSDQNFSKVIPSLGQYKLELMRHHDFLAGLGISAPALSPLVYLTDNDHAFANDVFKKYALNPDKTIVLFAGAQYAIRIYEHYGKALAKICAKNDYAVLALGTEADSYINQLSLDEIPTKKVNLSGMTSIRESAAIISQCCLAVGAETGLAHIACAVNTSNVIILGGGHFGRFLPYSPLTSVVCLPLDCYVCNWKCKHDHPYCIQGIVPETLVCAINESLQSNSDKPRIHVQQGISWEELPGRPGYKETSLNYVKIPASVYMHKTA